MIVNTISYIYSYICDTLVLGWIFCLTLQRNLVHFFIFWHYFLINASPLHIFILVQLECPFNHNYMQNSNKLYIFIEVEFIRILQKIIITWICIILIFVFVFSNNALCDVSSEMHWNLALIWFFLSF